jgi:hypothetical protein
MKILDYTEKSITAEEFVHLINTTRKGNKDHWYAFVGCVAGKQVSVKGYNTWLQRYVVDGLQQNTVGDISVKEFVQTLTRAFN